ncbi:Nuclear elongation and deformation protein 1 [Agyrium rufum]|nr:Nuclear elongation and deformation protein 1 [Agyrium rufum]
MQVEFRVNDIKQDYSMKLGEGGEAFFVFETSEQIPEALQTSPLVSPTVSPRQDGSDGSDGSDRSDEAGQHAILQEPDFLDLGANPSKIRPSPVVLQGNETQLSRSEEAHSEIFDVPSLPDLGMPHNSQYSPSELLTSRSSGRGMLERSASDDALPLSGNLRSDHREGRKSLLDGQVPPSAHSATSSDRPLSPPTLSRSEAVDRAVSLSKKLSISNIRTHVTDSGDLMLDMTGYKSSEDESLRAEAIARNILAEELEGRYDIGALIGADEQGNLWIYSSEEAKTAASQRALSAGLDPGIPIDDDAMSDPGFHIDHDLQVSDSSMSMSGAARNCRDQGLGLITPPKTPPSPHSEGDTPLSYAKTLRLTSSQLKALDLKPGPNLMSFGVNRATCQAYMYYWTHNVPVVISDIDGTITKSDALGHVLNMIGRDWTHIGVAKLYTDICANGYNILYLTSRSVGQADTTRAYLHGVVQEGYRLPRGPVILSPDRTIAALRREIYLRKPEVFKMACLRDILSLFSPNRSPFYAGFGNRLTDALSYRSVNIPSTRIFTINSNAEVSLDLLSLNRYRSSYVTMREVVDHFFPPVSLLVTEGGEDFTDFNYWRDPPMHVDDFSESDSQNSRLGKSYRWNVPIEGQRSSKDTDDDQQLDIDGITFSRASLDTGDDLDSSLMDSLMEEDLSRFSLDEPLQV